MSFQILANYDMRAKHLHTPKANPSDDLSDDDDHPTVLKILQRAQVLANS